MIRKKLRTTQALKMKYVGVIFFNVFNKSFDQETYFTKVDTEGGYMYLSIFLISVPINFNSHPYVPNYMYSSLNIRGKVFAFSIT